MGPAPTFLPEIKETWKLVHESIRAEVNTRNDAEAVLGTTSDQHPPLILTMLATRNGAEGGLLCEASDLYSPTITPICVA
jgi:hypothetical protein